MSESITIDRPAVLGFGHQEAATTVRLPARGALDQMIWAQVERSLGAPPLPGAVVEDLLWRAIAAHS